MKPKLFVLLAILAILPGRLSIAQESQKLPHRTYMFAQKDTSSLYLDVYDPASSAPTQINGKDKPTVLFMFGGGFKGGHRDSKSYLPWFKRLTEDGFRVVSIDYRLGLKGVTKMGLGQVDLLENAIRIAVEDLYSATLFIMENSDMLGIDPDNMVISGSSAGAISVMQGEWELCNGSELSRMLPEGFNYAGVMSFSGAVFSRKGTVRYPVEPCPILMFHGTADKIVRYGQIKFFNMKFAGAKVLTKSLKKGDCNYEVYRFKDRGHEIASSMSWCYDEEMRFIRENVMKGSKVIIDAMVDDKTLPVPDWAKKNQTGRDLYRPEK